MTAFVVNSTPKSASFKAIIRKEYYGSGRGLEKGQSAANFQTPAQLG
jgi:hypothetical protein